MLWALAAATLILICPQPGLCQTAPAKEPRLEVFVQGGAALYTDTKGSKVEFFTGTNTTFSFSLRKSFATSARTSAGLRVALSSRNKVEVNYSYASGRLTNSLSTSTIPAPVISVTWMRTDSVHASYVRVLSHKEKSQVYILGGMGVTVFSLTFRKEAHPSGTLGAGLDLRLNKHFSIRLEQRMTITGAPQRTFFIDSPTFDVPGKTFTFTPSVGLVWRFR